MAAVDGGARGGRRSTAGDVERFAHGMTVATNALLEGNAARTALVATEGFEDVVELGRQARRRAVPALRRAPGAARAARARFARARAHGARRRRCASWPTPARASSPRAVADAEPEAVAVVLLHAYRHPEHERAVGEALRRGARRGRARLALPRGRGDVPRVGAGGHDRDRRRPLPAARPATCGALGRAGRGGRPARAVDHAVQRRPRRRRRPRPGTPRGPCSRARRAAPPARPTPRGPPACATCSASTWAARRATCAWSTTGRCARPQGREVGGRTDRAADARRPHRRRGRRLDRLARRGRRAARRPALGRRRPGPAAYGRGGEEPTVTDANLVLGRLPAGGSLAGGVELDAERGDRARSSALAGELGLEARRLRRGDPPRREHRDGPRAAGHDRRARRRPAALRAARLRRRGRPARRGHRRRARHRRACSARAPAACWPRSASSSPPAAATRSERAPLRRRADAASAIDEERRRARRRGARGARRARRRLRGELDLRYRGQAFELTVARTERGRAPRGASRPPTRSATATRDPDGELELVTVRASAIVRRPGRAARGGRGRGRGGRARRRLRGRASAAPASCAASCPPGSRSRARRSASCPEAHGRRAAGLERAPSHESGALVLERTRA